MSLTKSPAWRALADHKNTEGNPRIADMLENEAARMDRMAHDLHGVYFDFSKQKISAATLELLIALARQQDVAGALAGQMAGRAVNTSENRAVLHTALRDPNGPAEVHETLARMRKMAQALRADKTIRDVVHIGIGGSDLGPRLVCDALGSTETTPRVHFAGNADPDDLGGILRHLNPRETIVIVASKTFSTQETMLNFAAAKEWLGGEMHRMFACTANAATARDAGFADADILPFWDWVGGRFSLWSSVGLVIALAYGFDVFENLLRGAHDADRHAATAPYESNVPVLMALAALWNRNFMGAPAQAVLAYSHRLAHLPAYVQQLDMESNGKSVDTRGLPLDYDTAPVTFGGVGTGAQHAFMQLLYQGTLAIPCEFVGVAVDAGGPAHALMANMLAQSRALMLGNDMQGHKAIAGNTPSTCIVLPGLDAYHLGLLLAVYEHKTAALGALWNVNAFDQFGVELGKAQAKDLLAPPDVLTQNESFDKSTNKLIFHTFRGK